MSLKGRTALVTGGGRGIGRAVCLHLAAQGADIAVNFAADAASAEETAEACRAFGVRATALQADVSSAEDCDKLVQTVLDTFGHIDILVNNAGVTRDNLLLRMSVEDFDKVINTNLRGAFLCMKAVTRPMIKQRYGRIVNISSIVGIRGNAGQLNYAASKAGLIGMTKSLAKELATRGVTVNAVAPGYIETDMTAGLPAELMQATKNNIPMARIGRPEDVAQAVAFFCDEQTNYITGQVLCVDGGLAV